LKLSRDDYRLGKNTFDIVTMNMSYLIPVAILLLSIFTSCEDQSHSYDSNNSNSYNYSSSDNSSYTSSNSNNDTYSSHNNSETEKDGYADGTYYASVKYDNPETGTQSSYTLNVEIEGGELVKIYWPNGGWLDDTHFSPPDISDGSTSFTSDRGVEYTVKILGKEKEELEEESEDRQQESGDEDDDEEDDNDN
jgi:hypothetical protein